MNKRKRKLSKWDLERLSYLEEQRNRENYELIEDESDYKEDENLNETRSRIEGPGAIEDEIVTRNSKLKQYGHKLKETLHDLSTRFGDPDIEYQVADKISKLPKNIGDKVIREIAGLLVYTGEDKNVKEVEEDEEDILSQRIEPRSREERNLESKINGILDVAQNLENVDLFNDLNQRLNAIRDIKEYQLSVNGVCQAGKEIAKARKNPEFAKQVDAFLVAVKTGAIKEPLKLFKEIVSKPYMSQLVTIGGGEIPEVPKHIEKLLVEKTEREKYITTLVEIPAVRHLPAERVEAYATNPENKTFFKNWIGANASKERVEFFDRQYQKYGLDGLVRFGGPLLKTIHSKTKSNPKIEDKIIECVHQTIPEDNKHPPKWIHRLDKEIEELENPREILRKVEEYKKELEQNSKEALLKSKYAQLVRDVRKTTPVARGDFTTKDILLTLDESLLAAMQEYPKKKTSMLEAMGKDLKKVNKAFRGSDLPAGIVVGLYSSNYNHNQILEAAKSFNETDKEKLRSLEASGRFGILFWLAQSGLNLDDFNYLVSLNSEEQIESFDKVTRATQKSRQYFSSLSLEQRLALRKVEQNVMAEVIEVVSPQSLNDYVELTIATKGKINGALGIKKRNVDFSRFKKYQDIFELVNWETQEGAKSIAEMILDSPDDEVASKRCEALKSLSSYTRIRNYDSWKIPRSDKFRYSPIAAVLKKSSDTELEIYGKIGDVYHKTSSWGSTREMIGFDKLQEIVKKTAELVDGTPELKERTDSFIGYVKNYTYAQEKLDDLSKLETIAKATASATPEESQILVDIGSRHVSFTFTDNNLQKIRSINDLGEKLVYIKGLAQLATSENQLETVLDYAANNRPEALEKALINLGDGINDDDQFYGMLAISRDKELTQKAEVIDQGYKTTFLKFAASVRTPEKLKTLPETHFYLAAQAYEFAKQHEKVESFFNGFNGSLEKDTVDKWAKTIIEYFRRESKGGGYYRKLEETPVDYATANGTR